MYDVSFFELSIKLCGGLSMSGRASKASSSINLNEYVQCRVQGPAQYRKSVAGQLCTVIKQGSVHCSVSCSVAEFFFVKYNSNEIE